MLSGVVAARRRRYVMMNAHVDDLPAIRAVLPSMGAPSVLQLADEGEIAVHAAVEADDIWTLLPALQGGGRDVDPRPSGREARSREGAAARRGDRRRSRRSSPTCASAATRRCSSGPSGSTGRGPTGSGCPPSAIAAARVDDDVLEALRRMIDAVRIVHRGAATGRHARRGRARASSPSAAGCRSARSASAFPAGASPLPSSLVMTAVPGAGRRASRRIAVVTPNPVDATLVVARELGLDEIYAVGGAQAVAALAYGTETIAARRRDRRAGERAT